MKKTTKNNNNKCAAIIKTLRLAESAAAADESVKRLRQSWQSSSTSSRASAEAEAAQRKDGTSDNANVRNNSTSIKNKSKKRNNNDRALSTCCIDYTHTHTHKHALYLYITCTHTTMPEESRSWAQEMARRAKCAKAEMRWQYAPTNYMCTLQINTASVCVCVWVERASARLTLWLCLLWSASCGAAQSAANDAGRDWGDRGKGKGNAAKPTNQRQKQFLF